MSNADVARPEFQIELDRLRTVRLDFNTICKLEELTGKNVIFEIEMFRQPSASFLRALLHCSLSAHDPSMTLEKAGQLLSSMPAKCLEVLLFAQDRAMKLLNMESAKKNESEEKSPTPQDQTPSVTPGIG